MAGETPEIILYFTPDAPEEIRDTLEMLVKEMAFAAAGQDDTGYFTSEILGEIRPAIAGPRATGCCQCWLY